MSNTNKPFDPTIFDSHVQDFLNTHSSNSIRRGIILFQSFYQGSVWDFLLQVDEDKRKPIEARGDIGQKSLQKFVDYLVAEGKHCTPPWSGKTVNCYFGAVTSFLSWKEIKLNLKEIELPADHVTYGKHAWDLDEFSHFISTMDHLKYQALTVCLFQSGLSISDLLDRTFGDVKEELTAGVVPLCLAPPNSHLFRHKKVGRRKKHVEFLSFIGQTGVDLLKQYLATREPLADSDPLFAVDQGSAEDYISRHAKKLYGEYTKMNPWRLHGLRDFFKKRCLLSPLRSRESECYIEYFSAHNLSSDIGKRYNSMTRSEWRNIYKECQPYLELPWDTPKNIQQPSTLSS